MFPFNYWLGKLRCGLLVLTAFFVLNNVFAQFIKNPLEELSTEDIEHSYIERTKVLFQVSDQDVLSKFTVYDRIRTQKDSIEKRFTVYRKDGIQYDVIENIYRKNTPNWVNSNITKVFSSEGEMWIYKDGKLKNTQHVIKENEKNEIENVLEKSMLEFIPILSDTQIKRMQSVYNFEEISRFRYKILLEDATVEWDVENLWRRSAYYDYEDNIITEIVEDFDRGDDGNIVPTQRITRTAMKIPNSDMPIYRIERTDILDYKTNEGFLKYDNVKIFESTVQLDSEKVTYLSQNELLIQGKLDSNQGSSSYEILGVSGKILLSGELSGQYYNKIINVSGLKPGTYVLRIFNGGKFISKKIIKL